MVAITESLNDVISTFLLCRDVIKSDIAKNKTLFIYIMWFSTVNKEIVKDT